MHELCIVIVCCCLLAQEFMTYSDSALLIEEHRNRPARAAILSLGRLTGPTRAIGVSQLGRPAHPSKKIG